MKGCVTLVTEEDEVKVDKIKLKAKGTLLTSITVGKEDEKETFKTVEDQYTIQHRLYKLVFRRKPSFPTP